MKNEKPVYNTVYKLWLGQSTLGKSCGFSKASFYFESFVLKHATAHIHKRCNAFKSKLMKLIFTILMLLSGITVFSQSDNLVGDYFLQAGSKDKHLIE
ncbi:hypothetical protein ACA086_14870, partial [Muriicola sp. E247]|uniref:hypothetical protein n=1 Tax=Muriicola sp. E247 TaxID=3242730 RepID=UPI003524556E